MDLCRKLRGYFRILHLFYVIVWVAGKIFFPFVVVAQWYQEAELKFWSIVEASLEGICLAGSSGQHGISKRKSFTSLGGRKKKRKKESAREEKTGFTKLEEFYRVNERRRVSYAFTVWFSVFFFKISYSFFPIYNDPIAPDFAKQETKGTEWIFYSNHKKCNCLQTPARCSWGKAISVINIEISKCIEEELGAA